MTWDPLWLSYQAAALATLLSLGVGVWVANLLTKSWLPGRELIDAAITVPMLLPPTVLGYYLLVGLGKKSAVGSGYASLFGSPLLFSFVACVIAGFLSALPFVVKFSRVAIESVDPTLVKAARTLGASPTRAFFTVTLPLATPGIIAGLTLGFAKALGEFGVTLMIAGDIPGETQTSPLYIYDQIMANHEGRAQGMILVLTATAFVAMWAANRMMARLRSGVRG